MGALSQDYSVYIYVCVNGFMCVNVWQSWVEIEHYSIAYFDHITAFKALQHGTSVKGGAHTRWVTHKYLPSLYCAYEPRHTRAL